MLTKAAIINVLTCIINQGCIYQNTVQQKNTYVCVIAQTSLSCWGIFLAFSQKYLRKGQHYTFFLYAKNH